MGDTWNYLFSESKWKMVIWTFLFILAAPLLITLIHELGHVIVALCFGWEIIDFQLAITYFRVGMVTVRLIGEVEPWQLILFEASGTYFTFCFGILFFYLMYRFKAHSGIELFLYLYGFLCSLEIILYIMLDVFILKTGDWFDLFNLNSIVVFASLIVAIVYIVLLTVYFTNLLDHLDLDISD